MESKTRTKAYFSRMLDMRTTKVKQTDQVLLSVCLQLRTQIAQNLAHLKGPPGVQFHERAPDAMDVDELPNLEAKVRFLLPSIHSGRLRSSVSTMGRMVMQCQNHMAFPSSSS